VIINSCCVASRKHFFKKDDDSLSVISKTLLCKVLIDYVRTVKKQSLYFWNLPRSKKNE
jgi:hypothetical protein